MYKRDGFNLILKIHTLTFLHKIPMLSNRFNIYFIIVHDIHKFLFLNSMSKINVKLRMYILFFFWSLLMADFVRNHVNAFKMTAFVYSAATSFCAHTSDRCKTYKYVKNIVDNVRHSDLLICTSYTVQENVILA